MSKTNPSKGRGRVNLNFNLDNPLQKMAYDYLREQGALRGASAYVTLLICHDMENRIHPAQEEIANVLHKKESQFETVLPKNEQQKQPAVTPAVNSERSERELDSEVVSEVPIEFDMAGIASVMDIFGS